MNPSHDKSMVKRPDRVEGSCQIAPAEDAEQEGVSAVPVHAGLLYTLVILVPKRVTADEMDVLGNLEELLFPDAPQRFLNARMQLDLTLEVIRRESLVQKSHAEPSASMRPGSHSRATRRACVRSAAQCVR